MYINDYREKFTVVLSEHGLLTTDTKTYGEINRINNIFDLNITKNDPYNDTEKNKTCFLEIRTNFENILVVFKRNEDPENFNYYYELNYDYYEDKYPNLFLNGILNIDLINKDNQLVLMYGISIIILDINTFEVINYTASDSINKFGIELTYDNNIYIVEDDYKKITKFDEELNVITK